MSIIPPVLTQTNGVKWVQTVASLLGVAAVGIGSYVTIDRRVSVIEARQQEVIRRLDMLDSRDAESARIGHDDREKIWDAVNANTLARRLYEQRAR